MAVKAPKPVQLGDTVTYVSGDGFPKAALVIATPASLAAGTDISLAEDQVRLAVYGVHSARTYARTAALDPESGIWKRASSPALFTVPDDLSELDDAADGEVSE